MKTKKKARTKKVAVKTLKDQARRVRQQFPELFSFLAMREAALQKAIFELAGHIPDPLNLPPIEIPESPVVKLRGPGTEEECKHLLEYAKRAEKSETLTKGNPFLPARGTGTDPRKGRESDRLFAIWAMFPASHWYRMYYYCRHGIYLRNTSLRGLASD